MADKVFAEGMMIKWLGPNDPNRRQNAPDFILGQVSFKTEDFNRCMRDNNNNGWINVDIKRSKGGKVYAEVDTWKPKQQQEQKQPTYDPNTNYQGGQNQQPPFNPTDDVPF